MSTEQRSTITVRRATRVDLPAIGRTLARAFDDDPVWRWLVPNDRRWVRGVPWVFRYTAREHLAGDNVWVTPEVSAAAIWAPPGHRPSPVREALVAPRMATVFRTQSIAGMRLEAALRAGRPTEPHWYLAVLGADPARQGRGHGSAVLHPVLDRCDTEGIGAYLESSKATNVPYYERHGFSVIDELRPMAEMPPLFRMWREPALGRSTG
jgi:ribosomal protein S18 acetylase RimI-like enzyme